MESVLAVVLEDRATEPGEHSYRAYVFGLVVIVRITAKWSSGVLCRFMAGTDRRLDLYDPAAPRVPFDRHLAGLVEEYALGRVVSKAEVDRRWDEEQGR
jgi:hypothetical protein